MDKEGIILRKRAYNVKSWIFWPRMPLVLEKYINIKTYSERNIKVIFIGKYENDIQEKFRKDSIWKNVVDEWHLIEGTTNMFTQEQYIENLSSSRYGLCLRGYGSKCHREVELMALGCVPLITPEVSLSYADPLIVGVHYYMVNIPEDIKNLDMSEEKWQTMSDACRAWYMKNIHSTNTMSTTLEDILYTDIKF